MIPRYTLPEMGAVWSDTARFEAMLRVELAVARAQAARGQVPPAALDELVSQAQKLDMAKVKEEMAKQPHDHEHGPGCNHDHDHDHGHGHDHQDHAAPVGEHKHGPDCKH